MFRSACHVLWSANAVACPSDDPTIPAVCAGGLGCCPLLVCAPKFGCCLTVGALKASRDGVVAPVARMAAKAPRPEVMDRRAPAAPAAPAAPVALRAIIDDSGPLKQPETAAAEATTMSSAKPLDFKDKMQLLRAQLGIADDVPLHAAVLQAEKAAGLPPVHEGASLATRLDALFEVLGI